MADLTIADLRDMTAAERAAHATAQQDRLVHDRLPEVGTIKRDDLVASLRDWLGASQIDDTLERLRAAGRVGGSIGAGGTVWRAGGGS